MICNNSTVWNGNQTLSNWFQEVQCLDGSDPGSTSTLTCAWTGVAGTTKYVDGNNVIGGAITQPTVTCGSTNASSPIFSNAPNWTTPTANTYNVTVNAMCDGSSQTANCGTLTVKNAPKISNCNLNSNATSKPTITLNDQSNVCASGSLTSETWYYMSGPSGTVNKTQFNWGSMPAGTYSGFSVKGTCNGYDVPEYSCASGSVTVSSGSTTPTATCNVSNITSNCYAAGDEIPRPYISCSSGVPGTATITLNSSHRTEWNEPNGKYVPSSNGVADGRPVAMTSVKCGGVDATLSSNPLSCGTINVKASCTTTNPSSSSSAPSSSSNNTSGPTLGSTTPVGQIPQSPVPVNNGDCVSITLNWNNNDYKPLVKFNCSNATNFSTTGDASCTGANGFSQCNIKNVDIGINNWRICVTFSGTGPASCKLEG
jgi:hypothetical protein